METYKYKNEDNYLKAKKKVKAYKGFYVHLAVYLIVNSFINPTQQFYLWHQFRIALLMLLM